MEIADAKQLPHVKRCEPEADERNPSISFELVCDKFNYLLR